MSSSSTKCPQPEAGSGDTCCLPHTTPHHQLLLTEETEGSPALPEAKPPHPRKLGTSLMLTSPFRERGRSAGLCKTVTDTNALCGSARTPSTTLRPRAPKGRQQSLSPGQTAKLRLSPAALPEFLSPAALWLPIRNLPGTLLCCLKRRIHLLTFAAKAQTNLLELYPCLRRSKRGVVGAWGLPTEMSSRGTHETQGARPSARTPVAPQSRCSLPQQPSRWAVS